MRIPTDYHFVKSGFSFIALPTKSKLSRFLRSFHSLWMTSSKLSLLHQNLFSQIFQLLLGFSSPQKVVKVYVYCLKYVFTNFSTFARFFLSPIMQCLRSVIGFHITPTHNHLIMSLRGATCLRRRSPNILLLRSITNED